jgi:pimeloyl-ACP methyl ester carboxylesterase
MGVRTQIIQYKKSVINILLFGTGDKLVFCFHGYGEDATSFGVLEAVLGKEYTLIAVDLPFHGKTEWNEGPLILPADLQNIIEKVIQNNNIGNPSPARYSLLAFSLGGRIALHLLQMTPSKIERAILIAPDGLRLNFWYFMGTQTYVGNKLFAYTMRQPAWFFKLMSAGRIMGLLNKSIVKFVHYYLDDAEARSQLYERWTTMRKFKPDKYAIQKALNEYSIPVRLLFGKYDRIILSKRSTFFNDNKNVKVKVIEGGHQLLNEKFVTDIALLFSQ